MMPFNTNGRDPDEMLVPLFRLKTELHPGKTLEEGRPIYEDIEVVDIRSPGKKDFGTHPATAVSGWVIDPETGGQVAITYAERFAKQYRQFKEKGAQTKSGTPLQHALWLTEARRAEFRALNIYTIEQLAGVDGQELKNLGPGGRDDKNRAAEYLAEAKTNAPTMHLQAELEALRARNAVLEDDNATLKQRTATAEAQFSEMTDEQLSAYIKTNSGHAPQGLLPRKTLVRMAMDQRPNRVA